MHASQEKKGFPQKSRGWSARHKWPQPLTCRQLRGVCCPACPFSASTLVRLPSQETSFNSPVAEKFRVERGIIGRGISPFLRPRFGDAAHMTFAANSCRSKEDAELFLKFFLGFNQPGRSPLLHGMLPDLFLGRCKCHWGMRGMSSCDSPSLAHPSDRYLWPRDSREV